MKFSKEQWSKLNKEERSWLVSYYHHENDNSKYGGYLPDDSSECPVCGQPVIGGGVCTNCLDHAIKLEEKMGRCDRK